MSKNFYSKIINGHLWPLATNGAQDIASYGNRGAQGEATPCGFLSSYSTLAFWVGNYYWGDWHCVEFAAR